jgi:hypothetical protein
MLEIGVRGAPYSPRLSGCAAKFACEMMGPKRGDTAVELGGLRYFQFGRLAALRNVAVECLVREADDAVDEISEDIGEALFTSETNLPTLKSVSEVSGALAINHQRQRSAGSSCNA